MAVHWEVPFRSLDGTSYAVRIYDDHYAGPTPISLVGAATPFVTQEDDDEDAFIPIRTQTGYLRIFDDGKDALGNTFDWRDLIPTGALDRRIEVVSGSAVKWTGYIQPQSFSGEIYNGAQEREFPVCDMLTMLKCWDVVPTAYQSSNFGGLLCYVFNGIWSDITSFVFNGANSTSWLQKIVMWSNFGELDKDGNVQPKYNCYEMLEEVCKFFGWTCRCFNNYFYFELTGGGSTAWRELSKSSLQNLANGSGYSVTYVTTTVKTAFPGNFASMENSETYLQGVRKAKVEADVNKTTTIVEYPSQEIYERFGAYRPEYPAPSVVQWGYRFVKKGIRTTPWFGLYKCKEVTLAFHNEGSGDTLGISNPYIYAYGQERVPHFISYNNTLAVWRKAAQDPTYLFRMTSHRSFHLNDGIIVISGKTQIEVEDATQQRVITYDGYGILRCMLKVGDKYWNGSSWTTTLSYFLIQTGGEDRPNQTEQREGVGSIWNTHFYNSEYPDYEGWGIEVPDTVSGIVEFSILRFTDLTYNSDADMRQVNITGLKIEFFRYSTDTVTNEEDTNKYTATGNRLFFNEKEVHTIFTCDNENAFGTAIIINPEGTYCPRLTFDDGTASAGQHLADRIAEFGSKTRRVMEIEVTGGTIASYNATYIYRTNDADYAPIAISRDWRNDVFTVKLLEVT